jgi:hypothetical protein
MPQEPAQLADKNEYTLSYATASCNCSIMLGPVIVSTLLAISLVLVCFVSRVRLPQLCMQVLNGCQPLSCTHAAILRAKQQYNRHKALGSVRQGQTHDRDVSSRKPYNSAHAPAMTQYCPAQRPTYSQSLQTCELHTSPSGLTDTSGSRLTAGRVLKSSRCWRIVLAMYCSMPCVCAACDWTLDSLCVRHAQPRGACQ